MYKKGIFKRFVYMYIVAAIWADSEDEYIHRHYELADYIESSSKRQATKDCALFLYRAAKLGIAILRNADIREQAAIDFWLNRNGHGAGFWGKPEIYGEQNAALLDKLAHSFGEKYLAIDEMPSGPVVYIE